MLILNIYKYDKRKSDAGSSLSWKIPKQLQKDCKSVEVTIAIV